MKKLRKSVNICQSYQKNKRGTFFIVPRCIYAIHICDDRRLGDGSFSMLVSRVVACRDTSVTLSARTNVHYLLRTYVSPSCTLHRVPSFDPSFHLSSCLHAELWVERLVGRYSPRNVTVGRRFGPIRRVFCHAHGRSLAIPSRDSISPTN